MSKQGEFNLGYPGDGITLKPCPFCGTTPERACRAIICKGCWVWMPPPRGQAHRYDIAVQKWNRRVDMDFME